MELFDVYPLYDITPVTGEDVFVFDHEGRKYLDLYGGHAVISVGHSHPLYVKAVTEQVQKLGFYSNSVKNPLQQELAEKLERMSGCEGYRLFLCNSGAEANENALKLASFHTGKKRVLYFENAFHGRTSGAVAVTDNEHLKAPYNMQHEATKLSLGAIGDLEKELQRADVAAVILEVIQGVGGLDEASSDFYRGVAELCRKHGALLIADEVQSGYGRTGDFFAFQNHGIRPDIISMAKGMGNGFPIGGILIDQKIQGRHGLLGTTFGGNHLACVAAIAVLDILKEEELLKNVQNGCDYLKGRAAEIPGLQRVKGRGLMLGFEFDFEIAQLRKDLLFKQGIFTGSASNKNVLRILPPLTIRTAHLELFIEGIKAALAEK